MPHEVVEVSVDGRRRRFDVDADLVRPHIRSSSWFDAVSIGAAGPAAIARSRYFPLPRGGGKGEGYQFSLFEEAVLDCEERGAGAGRHAELFVDVTHVVIDGAGRDAQRPGEGLLGPSAADGVQ